MMMMMMMMMMMVMALVDRLYYRHIVSTDNINEHFPIETNVGDLTVNLAPSKTILYVGTGCKVYYGQGYFTLNTELKSYFLQSNKYIRFSFTFYDN